MPRKIDVSLDNKNHLVIGTSGSGKSTWVKQQIRKIKPARLLIWDPDQEYQGERVYKLSDLARVLVKKKNQRYKIAVTVDPNMMNFDFFCRVAFAVLSADKPTMIVIEELADVTTVSKAPPAWGQLSRRGRKYGGVIFAITQRPAECDKTIYSQAPFKWCGYLENEADQKRVASQMGINIDQVKNLGGLEYLYKTPGPGEPERGKLRINRK